MPLLFDLLFYYCAIHLEKENHNIYFIGDGAGKAGNIVTAAATGLVAARDILNRK